MTFDSLSGFIEKLKCDASEKIAKQQEINHKMSSKEFYYGGFIIPEDALFAEAHPVCEWSVGQEFHDKVRAIILLPPPMFGAVLLYRLSDTEFCLKVFSYSTFEARFDSWSEMKNFCFAWGILQPPYMKDNSNADIFVNRLCKLDKAMELTELPVCSIVKKMEDTEEEYQETI